MKIALGVDAKLSIVDIETLAEVVDIGGLDPDTGVWTEFEISEFQNDLYKFVKWYTSKPCDYMVTFNGIHFDHQVLQFILRNYESWFDMDGKQIAGEVYKFSQKIIDDGKYDILPPYNESHFPVKCIDLFKIHHFDNKARRTSLKWCAYMMDMDVEEMPIHHSATGLSREDIETIKAYRRNDCTVTHGFLYVTIGQPEKVAELNGGIIPQGLMGDTYKGKNKIQDRFDVMAETGLQCLNWSDVTIGEQWNKLDYMTSEGIKDEWSLIPKDVKSPWGRKFKEFFPNTVEYTTKHIQDFVANLGEQKVRFKKKEYPITIGKTNYAIAKGGIHSKEKNRALITPPGWFTRDADVGSQYPWFIYKMKIHGKHLKVTIIDQLGNKIQRRIKLKSEAKKLKELGELDKARIYMSIQEMLKLCLNGGYYGKLNQSGSFLEYTEGMLKVTIGCQLEILMLIEAFEEAGITVVSGNTDGVVCQFPAEKKQKYEEICAWWENKVGNTVLGKLEYVDFEAIWQDNVNHYIGKKVDGTVKRKGNYATDYEIHKKKNKRIIALALEQYFIYKKNPIDFIRNHDNIFDFVTANKASKDLYYEEQWIVNGMPVVKTHKKLVRYFVSNNGNQLFKRGFDYKGKPVNGNCEAVSKKYPWLGQPLVTYFNKAGEIKPIHEYDINYDYYIMQTLKKIDNIEKTRKAAKFADSLKTEQISLF
jgi:hypothetical protein